MMAAALVHDNAIVTGEKRKPLRDRAAPAELGKNRTYRRPRAPNLPPIVVLLFPTPAGPKITVRPTVPVRSSTGAV